MIKGKEWLQEELSKLCMAKSYDHTAFMNGSRMPIKGSYNVEDVDGLVAQLGEHIDEGEQMNLLE